MKLKLQETYTMKNGDKVFISDYYFIEDEKIYTGIDSKLIFRNFESNGKNWNCLMFKGRIDLQEYDIIK